MYIFKWRRICINLSDIDFWREISKIISRSKRVATRVEDLTEEYDIIEKGNTQHIVMMKT